ncbi:MAG: helix-turn-helix domain-containing protein [Actinomycetota bacterium]|nr:helix-turn-helix domain-containing protein [Actinomycetota bacterium]
MDYLKIPELSRRLGVSEPTVRRMVRGGKLPSVFVGGAYRVSEGDLEKYLEGAKVQPGKAPGPAQLELEKQRGASEQAKGTETRYTTHEATGRILASNWQEATREWEKEIPAEGLMSDIKIGRLLGWTREIDHTLGVYRTIAQDSGDAQREEMQDTLKLMEKAVSEALKTTSKALEPAITNKKFRQILEANGLDAIMSEVEGR